MESRVGRWSPLTGVLFVILLVVSVFLPGSLPSSAASGRAIIAYAQSQQTDLTVSSVVIGISLFVGLLFYGQLRWRLRYVPAADEWATISFGGAVLFAAGGGVSGERSSPWPTTPGT